jgi:hypothetical protein
VFSHEVESVCVSELGLKINFTKRAKISELTFKTKPTMTFNPTDFVGPNSSIALHTSSPLKRKSGLNCRYTAKERTTWPKEGCYHKRIGNICKDVNVTTSSDVVTLALTTWKWAGLPVSFLNLYTKFQNCLSLVLTFYHLWVWRLRLSSIDLTQVSLLVSLIYGN